MFTAETLFELLCEQVQLLDLLIESGLQQQQAIEANRMSELVAILAQKQPHLERLGDIRQTLQTQQCDIEQSGFWPDTTRRSQCRTMREQASSRFEQLIRLEQTCEQALAQSRDQIQARLQTVDSGRHAVSAYQSQASAAKPPRFDFSSLG